MKLSELISHIPGVLSNLPGDTDPVISGSIVEDSRTVEPGGIFVARRGLNVDGHQFISAAAQAGVAAVVGELPAHEVHCPVPYIQVSDAGLALAYLAAAQAGFPARELTMFGITGTDGKTTTSNLLYSILKAAGKPAGMITTINAVIGKRELATGLHVTTPTSPEVQAYLAEMRRAGLTHCVLEATSHGLAQRRVAACDFDVAIVTNIQHEHLDFHGSWENYRNAKGLLFKDLMQGYRKPGIPKLAVINLDDPASMDYLLGIPADGYLTYGLESGDYHASQLEFGADYTRFLLHLQHKKPVSIQSELVGRHNISNMLAAAAAAHGLGLSRRVIKRGLEAVKSIPGRMERIDEGQEFLAVVDFAHTPNALRRATEAARLMIPSDGRVIVVFGSAGLRDPQKRELMGDVAARTSDLTIITAEDPRTESLEDIIYASARAASAAGGIEGETFWRIPDRGLALYRACQMARANDIVLACGKGHEQSMCFGTTEYPWDDRDALRAALRGRPLRTLPTAKS